MDVEVVVSSVGESLLVLVCSNIKDEVFSEEGEVSSSLDVTVTVEVVGEEKGVSSSLDVTVTVDVIDEEREVSSTDVTVEEITSGNGDDALLVLSFSLVDVKVNKSLLELRYVLLNDAVSEG